MHHYFSNDPHVMILVRTDHLCLRVRCHIWYQSITGIIRHVRPYFQKPTVKIHLDVHIRTNVVLTGGKLTMIYFMQFTFYNNLCQGKKISILSLGDVNPGPVPSRRDLLEYIPYRVVGATCSLCD
jgi:hypothetical protein